MEHILTMKQLNHNKDTLINLINESYSETQVKDCVITEQPNPWGWSPLASVQIYLENKSELHGQILHCRSASTFDDKFMGVLLAWVRTIP
jgi:hypothetical protein